MVSKACDIIWIACLLLWTTGAVRTRHGATNSTNVTNVTNSTKPPEKVPLQLSFSALLSLSGGGVPNGEEVKVTADEAKLRIMIEDMTSDDMLGSAFNSQPTDRTLVDVAKNVRHEQERFFDERVCFTFDLYPPESMMPSRHRFTHLQRLRAQLGRRGVSLLRLAREDEEDEGNETLEMSKEEMQHMLFLGAMSDIYKVPLQIYDMATLAEGVKNITGLTCRPWRVNESRSMPLGPMVQALQLLRGNDWERCVLLQQLGAASLRVGLFEEALGWLKECSELCRTAAGHPRDVKLFQDSFSTQQTRLEFASMVEKFLCQTCMKLGDSAAAQAHASEAQRLQQQLSGDAVERTSAGATDAGASARNELDPYKQLWAERPSEEVRLKQYRFVDEGPTVLVMLDLNDHLPIGHDASAAVTSLRQFRVTCEEKAVQIQLRLRSPDANGRVMHFILRLDPLSREIIPEDTVPRLRGKEAKRRLEVKLFKREKDQKWFGDLVAELPKPEKNEKHRKGAAPKGSLLNPLTPEEIAKLPKPGTTSSDNRPSSFVPEGRQGSQERPENERPAESKEVRNSTSWVEQVSHERLDGQVVLSIQLKESLSDVTMDDLDLAVDDVSRAMSLTFEKCPGDVLHLALPEEKVGDLEARWRKKLKTLELRFPLL